MKRCLQIIMIVGAGSVAFFLMVSTAFAHDPEFAPGGTSLQTATVIEEPAISWVYYGTLDDPQEVRYYQFALKAGQRLYAQLLTPREGPFPGLAVMGPGLISQGGLPPYVEAPAGGAVVVPTNEADRAEYEPFTPGAYWFPVVVDTTVSREGAYYLAVFGDGYAGPYGVAVGYEEVFTPASWIRLPADLLTIYAWDGGWLMALWPGVTVLVVGAALTAWSVAGRRRKLGLSGWLMTFAGIFCLATSATVLFQMLRAGTRSGLAPEMVITAFFIAGPAVIGALLLWLGRRDAEAPSVGTRIGALVLGLAAFGLLAGYLVGPVLAIVAAFAPPYRGAHRSRQARPGRTSPTSPAGL
jgi:hypothetical protein